MNEVINHYDNLISEGNDPVLDMPELKAYMDKWDGGLFLDLLGLDKTKTVLEIGVGTGRLAVRIAPFVKFFCGVDISPKTIEVARSHLPFENTELICADFLSYQFDQKFNIIYSSLTFMHFEDKASVIKKASELLLPNGKFVLSIDKNKEDTLDYGTRKLKVYPDDPETISCFMRENNFSKIRQSETEFAYIISANRD